MGLGDLAPSTREPQISSTVHEKFFFDLDVNCQLFLVPQGIFFREGEEFQRTVTFFKVIQRSCESSDSGKHFARPISIKVIHELDAIFDV